MTMFIFWHPEILNHKGSHMTNMITILNLPKLLSDLPYSILLYMSGRQMFAERNISLERRFPGKVNNMSVHT